MRKFCLKLGAAIGLVILAATPGQAQFREVTGAPARTSDQGIGPFRKMVIRNVTLIDGTGAPPRSRFDIVIEGNKIAAITQSGWPGLPSKDGRPPSDADYELDGTGMYVMPGFTDMHVHLPGPDKAPDASYAYKLWLAHGVTSVRGVPLASNAVSVSEKARSARNEIVAPRIFNYQTPGSGWSGGTVDSVEKARAWVQWAAKNGVDGIKFFNSPNETPEVFKALIDEAHKNNMGTIAHLSQLGIANFNARQAAAAGLDIITHYYGHMESLLKDRTIQDFPPNYDYNNEQNRFGEVAEIWNQVYGPGTDQWKEYLQDQLKSGVEFNPTFNIYAASRDLMRARTAEWHANYTTPQMWDYFQSSRTNHGSYFFDWTTENEFAWKQFYNLFFKVVNDYKNMGGKVTVGTDSGFIFKTYGFAYVEELELMREAGFNPLEIIRAATMWGAESLYKHKGGHPPMGVVRPGMLADLVITTENPLQNLKTLYGTKALRLDDRTGKLERVGGVRYTMKDGILYDAPKLLAEVEAMVKAERARLGASAPNQQ